MTGWAERYASLLEATARTDAAPGDVEALAEAAFFVGRDEEATSAWAEAHHLWARLGEADRAGRCAFWIGLGLLLRGEAARANGWFARGSRVVAEAGGDCAARGYLLIPAAMELLGSGDVAGAGATYEEVDDLARRCGDLDLQALARLGRGEVAIAGGDARTGLALLDEVMVAATTGEVSPLTTGILYCAVIDACVQVFDVRRAAEWTEALTRWCDGQQDLVPYRGQCLVHRSQVLQAHGEWPEALAEAARAGERLVDPPHPAAGVAFYQQGELHRLRGRFSEAEQAYRQASRHGRQPAPGLALLRLAEGKVEAAASAVRRMLDESRDPPARVAVLPAYVEVMVAAGDGAAAMAGAEELAGLAAGVDTPFVHAVADHAASTALLALGRSSEALEAARRACGRWQALAMPYERARSQIVVGLACRALGDHDAADVELEAAGEVLGRLGAEPDLARLASLRPAHAGRPASTLTERERDVLRLVAGGRTNRQIAASLVISEHTVARHVQNIFAKLGVSSRAAATAAAYEQGLVS